MNFTHLVFLSLLVAQGSQSQDLYVAARTELIDEKYEKALELFSQVVSRYPASEEADEAQFYIGYALEHLGRKEEALAAYTAVIERWPESPRVESARSHRAELAAALAPAGREEILDDVFSGSSWELKRDTAMALAREGNLSAVEVLEEAMERESSSRQLEILRILKPRVTDAAARRVVIRALDPGRSTGVQMRALQVLEPVVREEEVARAIEVLLSSGSASTSVNLEAVQALSAHLDRPSTRKAASRALETGEATAVQILACTTFATYLLSEELRPSVTRLYRESNATASQLQCLRGLAPRADDLAVAEVLEEAIASSTTATAVKLEAVSIASSSATASVRATTRAALRSGNATSVQLAAVKTLASGKNEEAAAEALEALFRGTDVSTSVLLAGLDSLESHAATNAAPRVLAQALTSNSATSVELRAVEIATPLVSSPEVRGALVRCLTTAHSTSVVLAAMSALEPRVSEPAVRDAFLRVLENREMSSAARVRAGDSLLPGADPSVSARIADAMEDVIAKARRRGGNADVVEKALSVLERIDRGRADRLRARPRAEAWGGPAFPFPAPAL